jgi:hypothetical protein
MTTRFYYLPITHHASEKPTAVAALQLREVITSWATNLTKSDATLELKARSTYARSTSHRGEREDAPVRAEGDRCAEHVE